MGRGGDAGIISQRTGSGRVIRLTGSVMEKLSSVTDKFEAKKKMRDIHNDLTVLKSIWFKKLAETDDHALRLDQFYRDQAHACKAA